MDYESTLTDAAATRAMLRRLIDGDIFPAEFRALEQRLAEDARFRAEYVRFLDLEASLGEFLDGFPTPASELPQAVLPAAGHWRRAWSVVAACALCLGMALGLWIMAEDDPRNVSFVQNTFRESPLRGHKHVAIVTHVVGSSASESDTSLRPGMRIKPGVLTLGRGELQLEFLNGAQVVLQAPAELHILSVDSVTLVAGRAAARVPEEARGFILNAPDAAIVDLGTEFAVSVDDVGRSEVHVINGEVEVSLLGDDGSTLTSQRLTQDAGLRVSLENGSLESVQKPQLPVLEIREQSVQALPVTSQYYESVLQSTPFLYWRFDDASSGTVPNEVGPDWSAQILGEPEEVPSVSFENGVARFQRGLVSRFVGSAEPITDFNSESFSIEFWVNPGRLHWATLLAIIPEGEVWSQYHLNVIELAHQTSLVHAPGSFRFLHRHPPNRAGGLNLFSQEGCTPGQWHHLVAVKTPSHLRLYLNGELSRELSGSVKGGDLAYNLVIGQLRADTAERQFVGSIDEFALYRRPLSANEIFNHYRAMFPAGER